jgi:hypothetical protein
MIETILTTTKLGSQIFLRIALYCVILSNMQAKEDMILTKHVNAIDYTP